MDKKEEIIELEFSNSDKLKPKILCFLKNIKAINSSKAKRIGLDFKKLQWSCPFTILPIASLMKSLSKNGKDVYYSKPSDKGVKSYLDWMEFPYGVDEVNKLKKQSYIPIVCLKNNDLNIKNREKVFSSFSSLLFEKINNKRNETAMYYFLSEIYNNIWEHSDTRYGWLFAQYYKNKKFTDICLLDNGITIAGSYANSQLELSINNDSRAIQCALDGLSTKKEEGRGFGLITSRNMVTKSYFEGKFLLISGNAGYYEDKNKQQHFDLGQRWEGTIVFMRINKSSKKVNWAEYVDNIC